VPWPFSTAELTAGLRRYFAEPALQVTELAEQPLPAALRSSRGSVRGLRVTYATGANANTVDCVVKEPGGAARVGLANAGLREAGVYRSLSIQLPMPTPALVAAAADGAWLVIEAVEAQSSPGPWSADDYLQSVALLARLHERFWGLADDLAAYPWLARPLSLDYEIHVYAAAQALGEIVREEWPPLVAHSLQTLGTLGQIISQAEQVAQPLQAAPFTLLHGDFWAGNIVRDEDGDMVVLDWQLAGLGPGVLDVLVLVMTSQWESPRGVAAPPELPLSPSKLVGRYRREIARLLGLRWSDAEWSELWDHALLWRFLQEMLPWLASVSHTEFLSREQLFADIWLRPVLTAADRRLGPLKMP
jgi:aminoglycoside phosphotransferase (APT) family kinase protein